MTAPKTGLSVQTRAWGIKLRAWPLLLQWARQRLTAVDKTQTGDDRGSLSHYVPDILPTQAVVEDAFSITGDSAAVRQR